MLIFPRRAAAVLIFLLGIFLPWSASIHAETYAAWKARVFSLAEQADPNVSGEQASPAGDGVPNLLKFAFDLDPHQSGTTGLPKVGIIQNYNSGTGQQDSFLALTWRQPSTYSPENLYYVPEYSVNLSQPWRRGYNVLSAPTRQDPPQSGDPFLFSVRALNPLSVASSQFLRLRMMEGQLLPEDWQVANFGHTGVDPNADADGDGTSNFQEFLNGTDPNDFYNGTTPVLRIVSGDQQAGDPGKFLDAPLTIQATDATGQPLTRAPVTFTLVGGSSGSLLALSADDEANLAAAQTVKTGTDGRAQIFLKLPFSLTFNASVPNIRVQATAVGAGAAQLASVIFLEHAAGGVFQGTVVGGGGLGPEARRRR